MSHVSRMNESCLTYEWVMSHVWMSHVSRMNESCLTYERVMSHVWMSHLSRFPVTNNQGTTPWERFKAQLARELAREGGGINTPAKLLRKSFANPNPHWPSQGLSGGGVSTPCPVCCLICMFVYCLFSTNQTTEEWKLYCSIHCLICTVSFGLYHELWFVFY